MDKKKEWNVIGKDIPLKDARAYIKRVGEDLILAIHRVVY
jgi:hypothetical protein